MPVRSYASRGTWTLIALLLLCLNGGASAFQDQKVPPPEGPPYRVGGDVQRPEKISGAPPAYPEEARKARLNGVVIIDTVIDEQGHVTDTRVLKGLPMGLTEAAVEAVKTWKFKPATLEGRPVPVYYTLTINFQVDDRPSAFGPRFQAFLKANPDFAKLFQEKHYQEAAELLDRRAAERPEDSEIRLARSYLLLEQGQQEEAWKEALEDRAKAAAPQNEGTKEPGTATGGAPMYPGGSVTRPVKISGSPPASRGAVQRLGVSGTVILEAIINEKGNVEDARVLKGLHPELDQIALDTLRTWHFKPATYEGKPVKVYYTLTVNFQ